MGKETIKGEAWTAGTSLDVSVAARIWYIGPEDSGTVTIATSVMTLQHGDLASEAVDTTVGSSGVLTMTGATLDTLGEVKDEVNSSPNWFMELETGLYGDSANATLLDKSETQAKVKAGLPIYFDGSGSDIIGFAIGGKSLFRSCKASGKISPAAVKGLLSYASFNVTLTGNTYLKIYSATQTETSTTAQLLYQSAGMTDSTAETIGNSAAGIGFGVLESNIGERLIVRVEAATSLDSVVAVNVYGATKDYGGNRI